MFVRPLADRMRPQTFDDIAGQPHLFSENGSLRRMINGGHITNMIFYGPPGTGKTTAANIIAKQADMTMFKLNATTASLSDVKDVISQTDTIIGAGGILLYLDEIQYFNKKQQQSLLEYIEDGRITLITSTTENPFFYVYPAIISRSAVFEFKPVEPADCLPVLRRALGMLNEENKTECTCDDETLIYIARLCGGDVRRGIGLLEHVFYAADSKIDKEITDRFVPDAMKGTGAFQRDGDGHFDLLSALQKSIRGSDPDAAVFYLAKLLSAGELLSVCRRLQVIASEDIGLAYPYAAVITRACCESAKELGLPEARIPLTNAAITLATAPKSAQGIFAYDKAEADIAAGLGKNVPDHLRDSHYAGAAKLGRGVEYKYPQVYPDNWCEQQYLPDDIKDRRYYEYGNNKTEQAAKAYWDKIKQSNE
ncbi:MAG: replication-associated recombination protein A [Clostridia bacterium]|nr:replication-associated recombination protein A [Clostridia bacterium]